MQSDRIKPQGGHDDEDDEARRGLVMRRFRVKQFIVNKLCSWNSSHDEMTRLFAGSGRRLGERGGAARAFHERDASATRRNIGQQQGLCGRLVFAKTNPTAIPARVRGGLVTDREWRLGCLAPRCQTGERKRGLLA